MPFAEQLGDALQNVQVGGEVERVTENARPFGTQQEHELRPGQKAGNAGCEYVI